MTNDGLEAGFWRDKRVFLTGHTGFKGSWLALWLQELGAQVTGYALDPPTDPGMFAVANVARGMTSVNGDIRDMPALQPALEACRPDILIHMAAQPLVRYSYAHPLETYATNVMGLVNVLESARHCPSLRAIVNVTSDKCYENREQSQGYVETDAMGGHDPYSSSKGCAELVTSAWRRSYGLPLASARAGNVIGGGDWAADRLVPDLLRGFDTAERVPIRRPEAIRPWQHVLEPLCGYMTLARKLYETPDEATGGWNFGPDGSGVWPVSRVAEHLATLTAGGVSYDLEPEGATLHEATWLKLDCTRAQHHLSWTPRWSVETALGKTVDWHLAWRKGADMRTVTLQQIHDYSEAA